MDAGAMLRDRRQDVCDKVSFRPPKYLCAEDKSGSEPGLAERAGSQQRTGSGLLSTPWPSLASIQGLRLHHRASKLWFFKRKCDRFVLPVGGATFAVQRCCRALKLACCQRPAFVRFIPSFELQLWALIPATWNKLLL